MAIFLSSVFASVLGAAIYSILLSKREEVVRLTLARAHSGWRRRRYVRLFIHAVQGEASVDDTRSLSRLLFVYPIAMIMVGIWCHVGVERLSDRADALSSRIEIFESPKGGIPEKVEQRWVQDLEELSKVKSSLDTLFWPTLGLIAAGVLLYLWMMIVREPFAILRRRFAHELDRFLFRIQGLASKKELAMLAQLESKVRDEAGAVAYVAHMKSIAQRHEVAHLVETFLLWERTAVEAEADPQSRTADRPA